jgi:hypothetical protein
MTAETRNATIVDAIEEHAWPQRDESIADMDTGQIIILIARWLLIGTSFVITLWSPAERDLGAIKVTLLALFALAVGNFYLHAQILMRRPVQGSLVYAASAVDIAVITAIIVAFGGRIADPLFVFYYPALLAFSLVFPLSVTGVFSFGLLCAYSVVALPGNPPVEDVQIFVARLISLAAVAAVGATYQRIERDRRRHAAEARGVLRRFSDDAA